MKCSGCQTEVRTLWTWRDPAIKDRYRGHGVESVCADCLYARGGPDYRGASVGTVLHRLERSQGKEAKP